MPGAWEGDRILDPDTTTSGGVWSAENTQRVQALDLQVLLPQLLFVWRQVHLPTSNPRGTVFAGVRRSL